jgi:hypothetical protein
MWKDEGIHLSVYATDDLRGALKSSPEGRKGRADADAVRALIMETE